MAGSSRLRRPMASTARLKIRNGPPGRTRVQANRADRARRKEIPMRPSVWRFASQFRSRAPTALTLAALAGLGLWGRLNDWRLPQAKPPQPQVEPAIKVVHASTAAGSDSGGAFRRPTRIEFPSAQAVNKAGIQVTS